MNIGQDAVAMSRLSRFTSIKLSVKATQENHFLSSTCENYFSR